MFFDNIPKIFWKGKFIHICGDRIWDNNNGASIFCKKLGYQTGVIRTFPGQGNSTMPSLNVGTCAEGDTDLSACTGGYNKYTVENNSKCTSGNTYKINCSSDGDSPKNDSCEGKGNRGYEGENLKRNY